MCPAILDAMRGRGYNRMLQRKQKSGEDALQKAGIHLENAIKRKLTGQRHGRRYYVPKTKVMYTASAPG